MKKILQTSFFCLSTLLAAPSLATSQPELQMLLGPYDYTLFSHEPLVIPNIAMWTINADCTIESESETNTIVFKALYKKGAVNEIDLARGDTMVISVDKGETIHLKAESGARVELTNEGTEDITARCYANFDSKKPFYPSEENIPPA